MQLWHGVEDASIGIQHGRWLADHVPGVEAHLIAGGDHTNIEMPHQQQGWTWLLESSEVR